MHEQYLTDDQIRRAGFAALLETLGPEGMVRFMRQFDCGSGDYSRERQELFKGETVASLCAEMRKIGRTAATGKDSKSARKNRRKAA